MNICQLIYDVAEYFRQRQQGPLLKTDELGRPLYPIGILYFPVQHPELSEAVLSDSNGKYSERTLELHLRTNPGSITDKLLRAIGEELKGKGYKAKSRNGILTVEAWGSRIKADYRGIVSVPATIDGATLTIGKNGNSKELQQIVEYIVNTLSTPQ